MSGGGRGRPSGRGGRGGGRSGRAPARSAKGRGGQSRPTSPSSGTGSRGGARPSGPSKQRGLGGSQVEGRQAVRELLLAGRRRVHRLHLSADVDRSDVLADIVELATELRVPVDQISRGKLDALSRTDAPQGVVAEAAQLPESSLDELCAPDGADPFLLAVDGVTDPGNLGALLRIAECAGVTGVVLPQHRAVHVTPTVTKAAAGAVEYLPMALVGGLPSAIESMKAAGVWVVGLDAGGDTEVHELTVADGPVCLILGAEGSGLSRLVRQRCDVVASIPLYGRLSSLNVAAAGAIACYELARRRSG